MHPEKFLRKQFQINMHKNKNLRAQTDLFKEEMEDYTVRLWRQCTHRCDEAIRQGLTYAKSSMVKKKK